jgi:hypothetical protein
MLYHVPLTGRGRVPKLPPSYWSLVAFHVVDTDRLLMTRLFHPTIRHTTRFSSPSLSQVSGSILIRDPVKPAVSILVLVTIPEQIRLLRYSIPQVIWSSLWYLLVLSLQRGVEVSTIFRF